MIYTLGGTFLKVLGVAFNNLLRLHHFNMAFCTKVSKRNMVICVFVGTTKQRDKKTLVSPIRQSTSQSSTMGTSFLPDTHLTQLQLPLAVLKAIRSLDMPNGFVGEFANRLNRVLG